MLRVRVELIPRGVESMAREIARVEIANMGGNDAAASYRYRVTERPSRYSGGLTVNGEIRRHQRYQSAFRLVQRVLRCALRKCA